MKCDSILTAILLFWRKMRKSSMHLMKKNGYTIHGILAEVDFLCLSMIKQISLLPNNIATFTYI